MKFNFNNTKIKPIRRKLRHEATETERILWSRLKSRQLLGYKFRRQYSIGIFIVDFYCPELKLVIEIDGSQHSEKSSAEYDQSRTNYFRDFNITVIRYWNNDIFKNIEGVFDDLLNKIKEIKV